MAFEKKWYVMNPTGCNIRNTYEEAEKEAKVDSAKYHNDQMIFEGVAVAVSPTPDIEIQKL